MVAGGIAVNLYGIERATADIDLVLKLDRENLSKFVQAAKKLELKPKVPVKLHDVIDTEKRRRWVIEKGMMVFSLYDTKNPFFLLDIFIEIPFEFDTVYKRRTKIKYEGITIPVVPLGTLIGMKEKSGRPQDKADIYYLKKIIGDWKDEK